jgi:hypothetical protein
LAELWNLATPYKPGYLNDVTYFRKSDTQIRVHGNDTSDEGGAPRIVVAPDCVVDDAQLEQIRFPAFIKFDYGVSASGGRGGACFMHMSVALDANDLRAKLPFFCLPSIKSFSYLNKPKSIRNVSVFLMRLMYRWCVCFVLVMTRFCNCKRTSRSNNDQSLRRCFEALKHK